MSHSRHLVFYCCFCQVTATASRTPHQVFLHKCLMYLLTHNDKVNEQRVLLFLLLNMQGSPFTLRSTCLRGDDLLINVLRFRQWEEIVKRKQNKLSDLLFAHTKNPVPSSETVLSIISNCLLTTKSKNLLSVLLDLHLLFLKWATHPSFTLFKFSFSNKLVLPQGKSPLLFPFPHYSFCTHLSETLSVPMVFTSTLC